MKIPVKYTPQLFAFFMSLLMAFIMSGILTWVNLGMVNSFVSIWIRSFAIAWCCAFPTVLLIAPIVRNIVTYLTAPAAK